MKNIKTFISLIANRYSLLTTTFLCALCINSFAQESRANTNPDYDFQQGRILFDQKQYAVSSQYFTNYLNQQNGKEVCELCQEAEYYIAINAYKLRDKNVTDILEAYIEKYPYSPMRSYINFLLGHSYYDRAKFDDAMKYYNQVNDLHLSEEDAEEFLFTKGYTLLTQKNTKKQVAVSTLSQALIKNTNTKPNTIMLTANLANKTTLKLLKLL